MRLRHLVCFAVVVAELAVSVPALAQDRDSSEDREWYGWQTAGLDVATGTLFVAGMAAKQDGLAWAGAASFALASPLAHLIRGEAGRAFGALALNAGVPFAAVLTFGVPGAFAGACPGRDNRDCLNYPLAIGMAVAMTIDAVALSWQDRPRHEHFLASGLAPFVAPSEEQVVLGVTWTS